MRYAYPGYIGLSQLFVAMKLGLDLNTVTYKFTLAGMSSLKLAAFYRI